MNGLKCWAIFDDIMCLTCKSDNVPIRAKKSKKSSWNMLISNPKSVFFLQILFLNLTYTEDTK